MAGAGGRVGGSRSRSRASSRGCRGRRSSGSGNTQSWALVVLGLADAIGGPFVARPKRGSLVRLCGVRNSSAYSTCNESCLTISRQVQYSQHLHAHDTVDAALDTWSKWALKVRRLGAATATPQAHARMQGVDGLTASAKHAHLRY